MSIRPLADDDSTSSDYLALNDVDHHPDDALYDPGPSHARFRGDHAPTRPAALAKSSPAPAPVPTATPRRHPPSSDPRNGLRSCRTTGRHVSECG